MNEINNIKLNKTINTSVEAQHKEIKPNNIKHAKDSTNFSTKKKVAIGAAIFTVVSTAVSLVYMIGRNPAKAAKVMKGNTRIVNKAYEEGNKLSEEILNKKGEFKITLETLKNIFKSDGHKTQLHKDLADLEELCVKYDLNPDKETQKAIKILKQNIDKHVARLEKDLVEGKEIEPQYLAGQRFVAENFKPISTIKSFIESKKDIKDFGNPKYNELSALEFKFNSNTVQYNTELLTTIGDCPKEVLPSDMIFYHGTTKSHKVYKNGLTCHASNQLFSSGRELGAGVYLSPDVGVSAYFSGLHGSIIPVKLASDAKIALVTENKHKDLSKTVYRFLQERMSEEELAKLDPEVKNALLETLFRKTFLIAGYDAAYIPKGVKAGGGLLGGIFSPDINDVIGRKQSQIVVFAPEKLEVAPRTLKERIMDLKDKFAAIKNQMQWAKEHPFGF